MPTTRQVTVGTTPTKVADAKSVHARSWMTLAVPQNASQTVYYALGDATVSPITGTPLYKGDVLSVEHSAVVKHAKESLWAIVASGTQVVIIAEGA